MSEQITKDLVCVYLNFVRNRRMVYDLEADSMLLLVNFMKKVLKKDPTCSLIKIRKITLVSTEESGNFMYEELVQQL